ncbi:MAG: cyclic nucleotide-binding domain-containing protein [Oligoflexia bacterium]|nr:cyclic nucleotide-binding domain-containing protein [Oligoflexia bacterium]MBF0364611.1 cyclic nucleotide-binding domain-containing protein [Oligoflexia bacterium]
MSALLQQLKNNVVTYKAGTQIIAENDESRKMFIIGKGQVRVFKSYLGRKIALAVLGSGEIFGELSFLDGEPRSASVEALTDVALVEINGDMRSKEMENLPKWVMPVMRAVCNRFRDADQRLTLLQSVYEFQKKHAKKDQIAEAIYCELFRYTKALKVLYEKARQETPVLSKKMIQEMEDLLGKGVIPFTAYWKMLRENEFLNSKQDLSEGVLEINEKSFAELHDYLQKEINNGTFLILGHPAIAILKRIILFYAGATDPKVVKFLRLEELRLEILPMSKEGIEELTKHKIIETLTERSDAVHVTIEGVSKAYMYQSIVKSFDHTVMNLN